MVNPHSKYPLCMYNRKADHPHLLAFDLKLRTKLLQSHCNSQLHTAHACMPLLNQVAHNALFAFDENYYFYPEKTDTMVVQTWKQNGILDKKKKIKYGYI